MEGQPDSQLVARNSKLLHKFNFLQNYCIPNLAFTKGIRSS